MLTSDELRARADEYYWFHSIDLGQGVRTRGVSELALSLDQLPDFKGSSVLDIGAWDGYYSFLAESQGASRVVALDHYVWGVDLVARTEYWDQCEKDGRLPDHSMDTARFWNPDLPGKRSFNFAKDTLNSKVEDVVADFATVDLDELGSFDVVLYLGVLYHMKEPLTCLERLRRATRRVAVIETEALHLHGFEHDNLLQFHSGRDVQSDFGNWYVPNIGAIHSLCIAAGFSSVETVKGPPAPPEPAPVDISLCQRIRQLRAPIVPEPPLSAPTQAYRAVVHAFV